VGRIFVLAADKNLHKYKKVSTVYVFHALKMLNHKCEYFLSSLPNWLVVI